jgi:hypothetical protein
VIVVWVPPLDTPNIGKSKVARAPPELIGHHQIIHRQHSIVSKISLEHHHQVGSQDLLVYLLSVPIIAVTGQ